MNHQVISAWRRASTAELLWSAPSGPCGTPVVPLVWSRDRLPCAAIPLAQLREIDSLPQRATLSVPSDAESPATSPATLVATGRIRLEWDLTGERFIEHLLGQEVAKHPPTRLRADSLMARRENWWWLPRALVTLTEITDVWSLPARTRADDALLVRRGGEHQAATAAPSLEVVTSAHWPRPGESTSIGLTRPDGSAPEGDDEPVYLFEHRHSPDFERWERWYRRGTLRGRQLHTEAGDGLPQAGDEQAGAAAPFTLLQRLGNHRRAARACKAGIAEVERRHS